MEFANYVISYFEILISLTAQMAPYLILGFLLAGVTHALFPREWIKTHLGGNGFVQSLKASVFGVPLPVCSCGIIPLAKELKKSGASNAGVAAFLASTPQTGVDSIAATAGLMGWPFAILRVIVAFISGITTGTFIGLSERKETIQSSGTQSPSGTSKKRKFSIYKTTHYSLIELPGDIRNSLTLGLFIAALISLFLPEYSEFSGNGNIWISYTGAVLLAIPLYVCSTGSIPIAIALIASGFSPGAALIFLIAGPATNIVTLITMTEIIGLKNTIIYLTSVVGIAILAALAVDSSMLQLNFSEHAGHLHETSLTWFQWVCFGILLFSIFYGFTQSKVKRLRKMLFRTTDSVNMSKFAIRVEGMGCKKCAAKVSGLIESIDKHQLIEIDLDQGIVHFEAEKMDLDKISKKLSSEGYKVVASL